MKIKCLNIYNQHTKQYQQESPWLTIGKEYVVLEITISAKKGSLYRLVGDNENKMPGLYESLQFEIVSDFIPSNWKISISNMTLVVLGPKEWRKNEFWDRCYDQDLQALEIYKREARIIYEEENT
jgi:hypothetical protein